MPLQNRVLPTGDIVTHPMRGLFMGNRGCLHDDKQQVVKPWASKAWIICALEYKGDPLPLMAPGYNTQLFFLDEASALAAGHRPCARCRRVAFKAFLDAWTCGNGWHGDRPSPLVKGLDACLHEERVEPGWRARGKRLFEARLGALPDGTMVLSEDGAPCLLHRGALLPWAPTGYGDGTPASDDLTIRVLTPPSTVNALKVGYRPVLHPSACGGNI